MSDDPKWSQFVQGFLAGDPLTERQFWDQYGPLLQRIAEKHMADRLRRRVDPEDVVQSACRTFFRRAQGGLLTLTDSESLWRLLCAITLTKIRQQARFHQRKKRGMDQEVHAAPGSEDSASDFDLAFRGPGPEEEAAFADHFENLMASLDEEERKIVELKLQNCTHDEIAEQLGTSERTVRRLVKKVQAKLAEALDFRPN